MSNNAAITKTADNIRVLSAAMVEKAKSGHPGGPMGGADFMALLYTEFLRYDPDNPAWFFRDRFFLDAGHMSAMMYSTLHLVGWYKKDDLKHFRQWGSVTPGHPEVDFNRGIENTSGPLGQGHTNAVGAAIAGKFFANRFGDWCDHIIYAYISDGGVQEEVSQGAGRLAGHLGLDNLVMFYDANDIQLSTETAVVSSEDTAKKYEAWGWKTFTVDGHDIDEIRNALLMAKQEKDKPTLIIGKTVIGKGAIDEDGKPVERTHKVHGQPLSKAGASLEKTITQLGGDPNDPFKIFDEVEAFFKKVKDQKKKEVEQFRTVQENWERANTSGAAKLKMFVSNKLPEIDYEAIAHKVDIATRDASGEVLAYFAGKIENMIVCSADLADSDKTERFLAKTSAFKKGDFSGSFLQVGVAELTMAAVASGMALHGGVIPVCATFFAFSDFMKPAIRLAALMELPVKYIWTHDAFRVGEDGPTHQPIEHEAQIRLLEKLKNHSKKNSMLVLRPADADETTVAWKMALENKNSPTGLILSRQKVKSLPDQKGKSRYKAALGAQHGAYEVIHESKPDVILVGNGSEVSTLYGAAEILMAEYNIKSTLISAISEGLFRSQLSENQHKIIPKGVPVFALTAGLPETMHGFVGPEDMVVGMESFGFSAPAEVLDEQLGFTAEAIAEKILAFLELRGNKF
ncbi:transketolase [Limibacter armeniacum]|uniref:transketolase family protein n=1 Tax=Limibacter armeniacum TaxID=466084 RepID=UPI002FE5C499